MTSGIYQIINKSSRNCYIGSTINIDKRIREHQNSLKRGDHHSHILQRAFNKYGLDGFEFKTLIICKPENLLMYEQRAIDSFLPDYNISKTAGSLAGIKKRPETLKKLSEAQKKAGTTQARLKHLKDMAAANVGKKRAPMSEEQKQKLRFANLGKKHNPEAILKLRAAFIGRVVSEQTRQRMSEARKKYWERKKANESL